MKRILMVSLIWVGALGAIEVHNVSTFCSIYARLYSFDADKKYHAVPEGITQKIIMGEKQSIDVPSDKSVDNLYVLVSLNKETLREDVLIRSQVEGVSGWVYGRNVRADIKYYSIVDLPDKQLYADVVLEPEYENIMGLRCGEVVSEGAVLHLFNSKIYKHRSVRVANNTNFPLYYAVYECTQDRTNITQAFLCGARTSPIGKIDSKKTETIENIKYDIRSHYFDHHKAYIIFTFFKEDLKEQRPLGLSEMRKVVRGSKRLSEDMFDLVGYKNLSWIGVNHTLNGLRIEGKGIVTTTSRILDRITKGQIVSWSDWFTGSYQMWIAPFKASIDRMIYNPLRYSEFKVRSETSLCSDEKTFVSNRSAQTQKAFQELVGESKKYPTVGICMSGGGYRAMISSLGVAQALDEIGIFNASTYWAGLSGSTWLISKYLIEQLPFDQLRKNMVRKVAKGLDYPKTQIQFAHVMASIFPKYVFQQVITLTDLYGAALAYNLFDPWITQKSETRFSSFKNFVTQGTMPLPIGTAVSGDGHWFEFTPFEVGSAQLKGFIPMEAFGRSFINGIAVDNALEPPLYYLMGTFGSAYALKGKDFVKHLVGENIAQALKAFDGQEIEQKIRDISQQATHAVSAIERMQPKEIKLFEKETKVLPIRFPGSVVPNIFYHKQGSPIANNRYLELRDAGIEFNLPFPPLLRPERDVNVIIAWDASGDILTAGANALKEAHEYAKKKNLSFPTLTPAMLQNAGTKNMTIFGDPDNAQELTIIYFPLIKNAQLVEPYKSFEPLGETFTGTFNFDYTKEQTNLLIEYARRNVLMFKDAIIRVLSRKAQAMNSAL